MCHSCRSFADVCRTCHRDPRRAPAGAKLATEYLEFLRRNEYSREAVKKVVALGDSLLREASGWKGAVAALRWATAEFRGDHFQGLFHGDLDGLVDSLLLRYTRHVATHGVPARDTGRIQERVKTRPHLSAR